MSIILLISILIISSSVLYYVILSLIYAIKSLFESSDEIFESEAEKLLLSNIKVPVSIIIPPVERYEILKKIIQSALKIDHPMFQVIVMLEKGTNFTNNLISDFSLVKLDAVYRMVIKSSTIEKSYRSTRHKMLSVIVADSKDSASIINTGIDVSTYPFICLFSEEYIPSKELLMLLEPPVIENEVINSGAICSASQFSNTKASEYYIRNIYSYSNSFSLSIPPDFAILLKKTFIIDKRGLKKGELPATFIRRMIKEGLKLKFVPDTGISAKRENTFLSFILRHLEKIICDQKLSAFTVIINSIYYLAFIILNAILFYMIFIKPAAGIDLFIPILFIFAVIPLKDIIILLNEIFIRKKMENPLIARAILFSLFKQLGIEQIISVLFIFFSIKRFLYLWSKR